MPSSVTMPSHLLITGASGGVGSACARYAITRWPGVRLTLCARRAEPLAALAAELQTMDMPTCVSADLSTPAGAEALVQALESLPPIDSIIHAVGSLLLKTAQRTTFDEWRACLAANLDSAFLIVAMAQRRRMQGSLVLFSSVAATTGFANHDAIAAAKAGIEGLMRSAAANGAALGLRVNAVAPGLTDTPLVQHLLADDAARTRMGNLHPLRRVGTADDQAAAACWLVSPESSWITGQVINVDGGLSRLKA